MKKLGISDNFNLYSNNGGIYEAENNLRSIGSRVYRAARSAYYHVPEAGIGQWTDACR